MAPPCSPPRAPGTPRSPQPPRSPPRARTPAAPMFHRCRPDDTDVPSVLPRPHAPAAGTAAPPPGTALNARNPRIGQERRDELLGGQSRSKRPGPTSASRSGVIARSSRLSRSRSRSWSRTSDHIQLTRWSRRRRSSSPLSRSIRSWLLDQVPHLGQAGAGDGAAGDDRGRPAVLGRPSSRSARPARGRPGGPPARAGRRPCSRPRRRPAQGRLS
jgi:hypothetical protein